MVYHQYTLTRRVEKAIGLATLLAAAGVDSAQAKTMEEEEWLKLARVARVRRPSYDTREWVVLTLQIQESARKKLQGAQG